MAWEIVYFNERLKNDIKTLPTDTLVKYIDTTDVLEEKGPYFSWPRRLKSMGNGLYEITIYADSVCTRIFYGVINNEIIILHYIFGKKQKKTPKNAKDKAYERLRVIKNED